MIVRSISPLRASLAVFAASAMVWLLELSLPRVYSLLFDYHYTFLSISLALSGLGIGAAAYYFSVKRRQDKGTRLLWLLPLLGGIAIALFALLTTRVSVLTNIYMVVTLSILPFAAAGAIISHAFSRHPGNAAVLYAIDLAGAAVAIGLFVTAASLGALFLIFICASLLFILIPLSVDIRKRSLRLSYSATLVIIVLTYVAVGTSYWQPRVALQPGQHKEMFHMQEHPGVRGEVLTTSWSSFGRTDLLQSKSEPDRMVFFIDGSAGSSMFRFNGDYEDESNTTIEMLKAFPAFAPVAMIPQSEKRNALIIGPGGGRDIHLLKLAGFENIDAVEVNGDLLKLGRALSEFNGGIFTGEVAGVNVIEAEGRGYVRRSQEQYDLIYLSIPIIKSSRSPEAFALTENFLFTVEAFDDYFSHLSDNGRLVVVTHDKAEVLKTVLTAEESGYARNNFSNFYDHVYAAGAGMNPWVVFQNTPLDSTTSSLLHNVTMATGNFNPAEAYFPYVSPHDVPVLLASGTPAELPMLSRELQGLADGDYQASQLVAASNFNLSPPQDDSPFFYNFGRDVPAVIDFTIFLSGLLIVLFIVWRVKSNGLRLSHSSLWGSVFLALGLAFMLIEIPLVQRFTLFLGRPQYGLTVVLGSLLLGGVIGSLASGRVKKSLRHLLIGSLIASAFAAAAHIIAVPVLLDFFGKEAMSTRVALAVITLIPLGIVAAVPFPTALRLAGHLGLNDDIPYYWGINGLAAVFGAATAVAISLSSGFTPAMALAVGIYATVATLAFRLR